MQYRTYQETGWPIGSGSVESANKLVVEARLKGAGMRWHRRNVDPMLVLRNAVCNHEWKQTWQTSYAQRHEVRTQLRQATSQQKLESALWFLAFWGVRVYRLSHPSPPAPSSRPGSGYSWHKPFLRRLPPARATVEPGAKK